MDDFLNFIANFWLYPKKWQFYKSVSENTKQRVPLKKQETLILHSNPSRYENVVNHTGAGDKKNDGNSST